MATFCHDYIERNGIASSIIGGWKFINATIVEEAEKEELEQEKIKLDEKRLETIEKKIKV